MDAPTAPRSGNDTAEQLHPDGDGSRPPRTPLTAGQVRAIFDVMRTFRDDDLDRTDPDASFVCGRCGRTRSSAGSLMYGSMRLCNGCATDYELLRTAGMERDLLVSDDPPE